MIPRPKLWDLLSVSDKASGFLLKCSCGNEMLSIMHIDEEYYLSLFMNSYDYSYSWSQRLRHIWQIITKGHPYTDSIVLDSDAMLAFRAWIGQQENK